MSFTVQQVRKLKELEAGSEEVLIGLIKRIDASTNRFPLGTPAHFEAIQ